MALSCSCDFEPEPGDWYYDCALDFRPLQAKRARTCCSCGVKIKPGDCCVEHRRTKVPKTDIEVKIYGEDSEPGIPLSSDYQCEECGGLFFSLDDLGFCVNPREHMRTLVSEHVDMHDDVDA